jgi:hypothetical protein
MYCNDMHALQFLFVMSDYLLLLLGSSLPTLHVVVAMHHVLIRPFAHLTAYSQSPLQPSQHTCPAPSTSSPKPPRPFLLPDLPFSMMPHVFLNTFHTPFCSVDGEKVKGTQPLLLTAPLLLSHGERPRNPIVCEV